MSAAVAKPYVAVTSNQMTSMAALGRLTRELSHERASKLAKEAVELSKDGENDQALRKLREAAALGHDNDDVQAALIALHAGQDATPIVDLCRRFAHYHDPRAGQDAVTFLRSGKAGNVGPDGLKALKLVLQEPASKLTNSQDAIVAELVRHSSEVRQYFVEQLSDSTTSFFDEIYDRGDESANCLRTAVLETKLWQDEAVRLRVECDLFVLFIAKLMESGHDHDGRALKGITLLLLADTERLYTLIDEEGFDALLTSLDLRLPADVRGQATLVITKFIEIAEQDATKYFTNFATMHISRKKGDDLILSFSAAAQLFPVATTTAAQLFLTRGFLPGIMPLLEQKYSSPLVHDAFLSLINAACLDAACRKAISETCSAWLSHKVSNGTGKQPAMAATVLAKLRTSGIKGSEQQANRADNDVSDLVDIFQKSLVIEEGHIVSDSVEGLAYTSLRPDVKERLANDYKLLRLLFSALENHPDSPEIMVGGLSILSNITHYQPNLSDEQKKMSQLKAYANASKPSALSPLEDDEHVGARCSALVKAGVTTTLVKVNKAASPATAQLTDKILLSLSRTPKDRGTIAQQGAVRLLILHSQQATTPAREISSSLKLTRTTTGSHQPPFQDAAHALARILISLNPSHIFQGSGLHITLAIPPLVSLLKPPKSEESSTLSDQPRDLLPVFESLLALTNLASSPDQDAANGIIRQAFDEIEDLLLSSHNLIRRAAVELICNLVAYPQGVGRFADGSRRATERLRILIAMADVDDDKTRSAAGGALAMLTEFDVIAKSIIDDEKFAHTIDICIDMIDDIDTSMKHRGFVVLLNLLNAQRELGAKARRVVVEAGGSEKVKLALREVREPTVLQVGVDVLKILTAAS